MRELDIGELLAVFWLEALQPAHDFRDRVREWSGVVRIEPVQTPRLGWRQLRSAIGTLFDCDRHFGAKAFRTLANQATEIPGLRAKLLLRKAGLRRICGAEALQGISADGSLLEP